MQGVETLPTVCVVCKKAAVSNKCTKCKGKVFCGVKCRKSGGKTSHRCDTAYWAGLVAQKEKDSPKTMSAAQAANIMKNTPKEQLMERISEDPSICTALFPTLVGRTPTKEEKEDPMAMMMEIIKKVAPDQLDNINQLQANAREEQDDDSSGEGEKDE